MDILISYPWLALVASGVFTMLSLKFHSKMAALVAILWACYSGYEFLIQERVLCSGECNIRVDLLLIYPILLVLSVFAIVNGIRAWKRMN